MCVSVICHRLPHSFFENSRGSRAPVFLCDWRVGPMLPPPNCSASRLIHHPRCLLIYCWANVDGSDMEDSLCGPEVEPLRCRFSEGNIIFLPFEMSTPSLLGLDLWEESGRGLQLGDGDPAASPRLQRTSRAQRHRRRSETALSRISSGTMRKSVTGFNGPSPSPSLFTVS